MRVGDFCKVIGVAALSFGAGILISFFVPDSVLVVLEATIIIGAGVLCFNGTR